MTRRIAELLVLMLALLAGCHAAAPTEIRVLSYNIRHGEGMDGKIDLERIAAVIRAADPDLVALQEVDRGVRRTNGEDQPARLAELTGMQAVFEKNIDFQGGEYGNAILSRLPVVSHCNHPLPKMYPSEQRGVLEVRVRAGGRPLMFLATHFDYHPDDSERVASVQTLKKLVDDQSDMPVIVAGDLNSTPESRVIQLMSSFLSDACGPAITDVLTFPAENAERRIDYIFFSADLRVTEFRVIAEPIASDHRPILATLVMQGDAK